MVAGAAYELGPQGTTFAKPVTLEFKYAKGLVPDSIDALRAVHRYTNGKWVVLPQTRYGSDSNGVVIAETNSFSTYAVRNASSPVDIKVSPAPLRLNPGQSATFSGIVMDQYGDPMSLPITWIDLGVSLTASISSAGLATGYRPGGPRAIQAQASKTFPKCFSDEERNCNTAAPVVRTGIGNGEIFVELIPVKTISITPPASTLLSGQTATLVPVLKDSAGITLSLDFRTIAWATQQFQ